MTSSTVVLPVVRCPGLRADSLGHYLAALGTLRTAARRWPRCRAAWRDGRFCLVGGPDDLVALVAHLIGIGRGEAWTLYDRAWKAARDSEKKRKLGEPSPLSIWRAQATEEQAELSLAHTVATDRLYDNPLLGQGGAASRRDFSKGWADAVSKISKGSSSGVLDADLARFLQGETCSVLGPWNAASWFSQANKLYNFSASKAFVEGQLTPWAMALACEGLVFFAGSPSRRLGARARGRGAFPFVTAAAAPEQSGRLACEVGEVWCPLWSRPMTLAEVRWLFLRGRAELDGRGALTPAAFATSVVRRGVDAGVDSFARFVLGQTTNPDMFEARAAQRVEVGDDITTATVAERVLAFIECLPNDKTARRNGRFLGFRGPVEAAMIDFAARPRDPEAAGRVLSAVAESLDRVDRSSRVRRESRVRWELLPTAWVPTLFGDGEPPLEARLAAGLAAVGARDRHVGPLVAHRFGVEIAGRRLQFPAARPARAVWTGADVEGDLARIVHRRLVDVERTATSEGTAPVLPFGSSVSVAEADVAAWLDGLADPRLVDVWLRRMVLFDWRDPPPAVASPVGGGARPSATLHLYGLFRSLLDPRPLRTASGQQLVAANTGARAAGSARRVTSLVVAGQLDVAMATAFSRYRVAGHPPARFDTTWGPLDRRASVRLVASLLFQPRADHLVALAQHWIRPTRNREEA